jgi:hypothetical protein
MFSLAPNIAAVQALVKDLKGKPALLGGYHVHYRGGNWTGATRTVVHAPSLGMFGSCPSWVEVQAKVRFAGLTLHRPDHEGGGSYRLPPGSEWVRVA